MADATQPAVLYPVHPYRVTVCYEDRPSTWRDEVAYVLAYTAADAISQVHIEYQDRRHRITCVTPTYNSRGEVIG